VRLYQTAMADRNLSMPVMDVLANLATFAKKPRGKAYETMREGIDICDALDAEIVHLAGCQLVEGETAEDGRKWVVEGLMAFVDDVESRGMTLAFENFNPAPTLICSAADCLDILEQTGNRVKFVFDTGNFEATGEHAEDNLAKLIDHTCHFHFKDFANEEDSRICNGTHFGEGRIKNREIAREIRENGYDGWIALESYPQSGNGPRETIPKEVAVLKSMF
jgi:sugar phosphate isomerase/epimerase